ALARTRTSSKRSSRRSIPIWLAKPPLGRVPSGLGKGLVGLKRRLLAGMEVAGCALPLEPFAIAHPIFAFDPVDLGRLDAMGLERGAAHRHRSLEQFALGES